MSSIFFFYPPTLPPLSVHVSLFLSATVSERTMLVNFYFFLNAAFLSFRKKDDSDVRVDIMWSFALVNLVIDFVNLGFFWSNDGASSDPPTPTLKQKYKHGNVISESSAETQHGDSEIEEMGINLKFSESYVPSANDTSELNLNMMSALTHIIADTLRSLAVLIAALMSQYSANISGSRADDWAAILVSVCIAISTIPLILAMCRKMKLYSSMVIPSGAVEQAHFFVISDSSGSSDSEDGDHE